MISDAFFLYQIRCRTLVQREVVSETCLRTASGNHLETLTFWFLWQILAKAIFALKWYYLLINGLSLFWRNEQALISQAVQERPNLVQWIVLRILATCDQTDIFIEVNVSAMIFKLLATHKVRNGTITQLRTPVHSVSRHMNNSHHHMQ